MKARLHVYRGTNPGTASCDFTGANYIGHDQGDEHRTVEEIDGVTPDLEAELTPVFLAANVAFETLKGVEPTFGGNVATLLGLEGTGPVGLRLGFWPDDDDNPAGG